MDLLSDAIVRYRITRRETRWEVVSHNKLVLVVYTADRVVY